MATSKILELIQKNADHIKKYGVRKIGVFGSFAKKKQHSKSDVDILVEFNPLRKTFDNYMDLKFFFENLFHRKVDLVMESALKLRIKNRVLSEVVYARL